MRAVVQRVSAAAVEADGERLAEIRAGMLVFLGVTRDDGDDQVKWMADKLAGLRIFEDEGGKMNLSVSDAGGEILLVSNFTVCGDARKGKRPSFDDAAPADRGKELFEAVVTFLKVVTAIPIEAGRFGADMQVSLVNDGPVTLVIDSPGNRQ